MKKIMVVALAVLMAASLFASDATKSEVISYIKSLDNGKVTGINSYYTGYDDMVAYCKENGIIPKGATGKDMNTNPGYVKKYDGTYNEVIPFADKAYDFDGVYLIWFDLLGGSAYKANYTGMINNAGTIVINGGAYTVTADTNSGCYALAFSSTVSDDAKSAATKAFKKIKKDKANLCLYTGDELAAALVKGKIISAADLGNPQDLNKVYTYIAKGRDWVGKYNAETNPKGTESGYTDYYDKTYYVAAATTAKKYGNVSIYWYDTSDSMFEYYAQGNTYKSLQASAKADGTAVGTLYEDIDSDWVFQPLKVKGTAYDAAGTTATFKVDLLIGQFAIVID